MNEDEKEKPSTTSVHEIVSCKCFCDWSEFSLWSFRLYSRLVLFGAVFFYTRQNKKMRLMFIHNQQFTKVQEGFLELLRKQNSTSCCSK